MGNDPAGLTGPVKIDIVRKLIDMAEKLILSPLSKTWILDLDGTLVKHNGYKTETGDELLPGTKDFLKNIPEKDMIIIVTGRSSEDAEKTERFLAENHIRYDHIIYDAPYGERLLFNDRKPSGLQTAYAVSPDRDAGIDLEITIDPLR